MSNTSTSTPTPILRSRPPSLLLAPLPLQPSPSPSTTLSALATAILTLDPQRSSSPSNTPTPTHISPDLTWSLDDSPPQAGANYLSRFSDYASVIIHETLVDESQRKVFVRRELRGANADVREVYAQLEFGRDGSLVRSVEWESRRRGSGEQSESGSEDGTEGEVEH